MTVREKSKKYPPGDNRHHPYHSDKEKLRYMKVLEQSDMNLSLAAKRLNIHRITMAKYYKQFWAEYNTMKADVFDDSLTVESQKLARSFEISLVEKKVSNTFDLLIKEFDTRLKDQYKREKISSKDLVQAISVLIPYLAEKKILLGAKSADGSPSGNHTMFVQNIVQQIVNSKPNTYQLEETEDAGSEDTV